MYLCDLEPKCNKSIETRRMITRSINIICVSFVPELASTGKKVYLQPRISSPLAAKIMTSPKIVETDSIRDLRDMEVEEVMPKVVFEENQQKTIEMTKLVKPELSQDIKEPVLGAEQPTLLVKESVAVNEETVLHLKETETLQVKEPVLTMSESMVDSKKQEIAKAIARQSKEPVLQKMDLHKEKESELLKEPLEIIVKEPVISDAFKEQIKDESKPVQKTKSPILPVKQPVLNRLISPVKGLVLNGLFSPTKGLEKGLKLERIHSNPILSKEISEITRIPAGEDEMESPETEPIHSDDELLDSNTEKDLPGMVPENLECRVKLLDIFLNRELKSHLFWQTMNPYASGKPSVKPTAKPRGRPRKHLRSDTPEVPQIEIIPEQKPVAEGKAENLKLRRRSVMLKRAASTSPEPPPSAPKSSRPSKSAGKPFRESKGAVPEELFQSAAAKNARGQKLADPSDENLLGDDRRGFAQTLFRLDIDKYGNLLDNPIPVSCGGNAPKKAKTVESSASTKHKNNNINLAGRAIKHSTAEKKQNHHQKQQHRQRPDNGIQCESNLLQQQKPTTTTIMETTTMTTTTTKTPTKAGTSSRCIDPMISPNQTSSKQRDTMEQKMSAKEKAQQTQCDSSTNEGGRENGGEEKHQQDETQQLKSPLKKGAEKKWVQCGTDGSWRIMEEEDMKARRSSKLADGSDDGSVVVKLESMTLASGITVKRVPIKLIRNAGSNNTSKSTGGENGESKVDSLKKSQISVSTFYSKTAESKTTSEKSRKSYSNNNKKPPVILNGENVKKYSNSSSDSKSGENNVQAKVDMWLEKNGKLAKSSSSKRDKSPENGLKKSSSSSSKNFRSKDSRHRDREKDKKTSCRRDSDSSRSSKHHKSEHRSKSSRASSSVLGSSSTKEEIKIKKAKSEDPPNCKEVSSTTSSTAVVAPEPKNECAPPEKITVQPTVASSPELKYSPSSFTSADGKGAILRSGIETTAEQKQQQQTLEGRETTGDDYRMVVTMNCYDNNYMKRSPDDYKQQILEDFLMPNGLTEESSVNEGHFSNQVAATLELPLGNICEGFGGNNINNSVPNLGFMTTVVNNSVNKRQNNSSNPTLNMDFMTAVNNSSNTKPQNNISNSDQTTDFVNTVDNSSNIKPHNNNSNPTQNIDFVKVLNNYTPNINSIENNQTSLQKTNSSAMPNNVNDHDQNSRSSDTIEMTRSEALKFLQTPDSGSFSDYSKRNEDFEETVHDINSGGVTIKITELSPKFHVEKKAEPQLSPSKTAKDLPEQVLETTEVPIFAENNCFILEKSNQEENFIQLPILQYNDPLKLPEIIPAGPDLTQKDINPISVEFTSEEVTSTNDQIDPDMPILEADTNSQTVVALEVVQQPVEVNNQATPLYNSEELEIEILSSTDNCHEQALNQPSILDFQRAPIFAEFVENSMSFKDFKPTESNETMKCCLMAKCLEAAQFQEFRKPQTEYRPKIKKYKKKKHGEGEMSPWNSNFEEGGKKSEKKKNGEKIKFLDDIEQMMARLEMEPETDESLNEEEEEEQKSENEEVHPNINDIIKDALQDELDPNKAVNKEPKLVFNSLPMQNGAQQQIEVQFSLNYGDPQKFQELLSSLAAEKTKNPNNKMCFIPVGDSQEKKNTFIVVDRNDNINSINHFEEAKQQAIAELVEAAASSSMESDLNDFSNEASFGEGESFTMESQMSPMDMYDMESEPGSVRKSNRAKITRQSVYISGEEIGHMMQRKDRKEKKKEHKLRKKLKKKKRRLAELAQEQKAATEQQQFATFPIITNSEPPPLQPLSTVSMPQFQMNHQITNGLHTQQESQDSSKPFLHHHLQATTTMIMPFNQMINTNTVLEPRTLATANTAENSYKVTELILVRGAGEIQPEFIFADANLR